MASDGYERVSSTSSYRLLGKRQTVSTFRHADRTW